MKQISACTISAGVTPMLQHNPCARSCLPALAGPKNGEPLGLSIFCTMQEFRLLAACYCFAGITASEMQKNLEP